MAFVIAVVKKFSDDRAGRLAALIAYYGFFSIFPLLLAAVTILAYAVSNTAASQLKESALASIPVVGDDIGAAVGKLGGSVIALAAGLGTAIWAGLACMQAAQDAMNEIWAVPRFRQPSFVRKRARSVATLVVVALALAAGAVLSQLVALLPDLPGVARVLGSFGSVAGNAVAFLVAFQLLAAGSQRWSNLVPGAVIAGCAYSALQVVGRWYVERSVSGAQDTYGTFAVVIGLLGWLYLLAQLTLIAAEVNVVRARRLWPRSLRGDDPSPADLEMIRISARMARTRPSTRILVQFDRWNDASIEDVSES